MFSHVPAGSKAADTIAASRVASSSSTPRPTSAAAAKVASGGVPSVNLVNASKPTIVPVVTVTIGWNTGWNARAAITRRTDARRCVEVPCRCHLRAQQGRTQDAGRGEDRLLSLEGGHAVHS